MAAICLWGLVPRGTAIAAEPGRSATWLYQKVKPATVEILVEGHQAGSGSFVSADGLVVTAAHVLGRADRHVEVLTAEFRRLPASLLAVDLGHDVVLLRVPPADGGYPALELARAMPPPGAHVFLLSSAAFRHHVLQRGMIARDGLTFEYQGHFVEVMQVAALVQEGTSGGAWLNEQGELVGVQSGSITVKGMPGGLANVAPVAAVRALVRTKNNAASATIGAFLDELWVVKPEQLRRFPPGSEGLVVQAVRPDGPADRAGIRKGDVITAADGQPVRLRDDFLRFIRARKPGQTITLTVLGPDGTGSRQTPVRLGKLEVGWRTVHGLGQAATTTAAPSGAATAQKGSRTKARRCRLGQGATSVIFRSSRRRTGKGLTRISHQRS